MVNIHPATPLGQEKFRASGLMLKGLLRLGLLLALMAAVLFVSSGHPAWVKAWLLLGALSLCVVVNLFVLLGVNPELVAERLGAERPVRPGDRLLAVVITAFWWLALIIAGLDSRLGWSPPLPGSVPVAALVVLIAGDLLFLWAMALNRFFTRFVRIQRERDHRVVSASPYRDVRHPGYLGWILMSAAVPLVLGSLVAVIPVGCAVFAMVVRTALEDTTLRGELKGYEEYTGRVPYRLIPGVW
jgi:protein-S-isoprenylcysteine O-methyltransferase Ste14